MQQYKAALTLLLAALIVIGCLELTDAVNLAPGLVPPPRAPSPSPVPQDSIQLLQENVNVVMSGDHEVDLSQPPKRIDIPIELEVVPKKVDTNAQSANGQPEIVSKPVDVVGLADSVNIDGINWKPVTPSSAKLTGTKEIVTEEPQTTPEPTTPEPTRSTTPKPINSGTRLEVGLLLTTVLIISTCMNMQRLIR